MRASPSPAQQRPSSSLDVQAGGVARMSAGATQTSWGWQHPAASAASLHRRLPAGQALQAAMPVPTRRSLSLPAAAGKGARAWRPAAAATRTLTRRTRPRSWPRPSGWRWAWPSCWAAAGSSRARSATLWTTSSASWTTWARSGALAAAGCEGRPSPGCSLQSSQHTWLERAPQSTVLGKLCLAFPLPALSRRPARQPSLPACAQVCSLRRCVRGPGAAGGPGHPADDDLGRHLRRRPGHAGRLCRLGGSRHAGLPHRALRRT